jgi:hypothetical protein
MPWISHQKPLPVDSVGPFVLKDTVLYQRDTQRAELLKVGAELFQLRSQ